MLSHVATWSIVVVAWCLSHDLPRHRKAELVRKPRQQCLLICPKRSRWTKLNSFCGEELKGHVNLQWTRRLQTQKRKNPLFNHDIVCWEGSLPSQTSTQISIQTGQRERTKGFRTTWYCFNNVVCACKCVCKEAFAALSSLTTEDPLGFLDGFSFYQRAGSP